MRTGTFAHQELRVRTCRSALAVGIVFLCVQLTSADEPKADALPKGAKVRLGTEQFGFRFSPSGVQLPPEFRTMLIPDTVNGFRRFDVATGKPLDDFKSVGPGSVGLVVSANGRRGVLANSGILTVRDTATGKLLATRNPTLPFAPVGGKDDENIRSIRVWDVSEKKELFKARITTGAFQIPACAFSPDGSLFAGRTVTEVMFELDETDKHGQKGTVVLRLRVLQSDSKFYVVTVETFQGTPGQPDPNTIFNTFQFIK
jgi:hypothetical protein